MNFDQKLAQTLFRYSEVFGTGCSTAGPHEPWKCEKCSTVFVQVVRDALTRQEEFSFDPMPKC